MVWDLKKVLSNVLIAVGLYYLLVSAKIIDTSVIWMKDALPPTSKSIFIVAVILLGLGLMLNEQILRRLKNVFK